jgi:hydroxyacylglutathione hydrolase
MQIRQFRYAADNLGYLVASHGEALAIDGGAVKAIMAAVEKEGLNLAWVANTHGHPDHTSGTAKLARLSGAERLSGDTLLKQGTILVGGQTLTIHHTPGHTAESISFELPGALITGDTLFNGTVGNCFSGDLKGFYRSIKLLTGFPAETLVYAGHDYVADSMAFARSIEPDNPHIDGFLGRHDPNLVVSTLADEMRVNPYVRFNDAAIIALLKARGLPVGSEYERWESIMSLG